MNENVSTVMQNLRIVGRSPKLQQAVSAAIQAAPYNASVLIFGENGSGKEVFHKILHNYNPTRRDKKRIAVNCGALPDGTINSELFGHTKGAYTGAISDRKGFFEEADGGTIFLDEVGELPLDTQARLLRVLETGEYQRMGSTEVRTTNVRIVAATNRDLLEAIRRGTFREDLYYRLSTITIRVPALRERPEDIDLLFRYFANEIADKYNIPGISLDANARQMLLAYQWPGNVRQLLHLVEEISIVEQERTITTEILHRFLPDFESRMAFGGPGKNNADEFLPGEKAALYQLIFNMRQQLEDIRQHLGISDHAAAATVAKQTLALGPAISQPIITTQSHAPIDNLVEQDAVEVVMTAPEIPVKPAAPKTLSEMEREAIIEALRRNKGNKSSAAKDLDISVRTIHRKIEEYGIES